jgi:SHS2 domain-containing protein
MRLLGETSAELYLNAARGMMHYLFGTAVLNSSPQDIEQINLAAPDAESLLVDWLSALLYRAATRYAMITVVSIHITAETSLAAQIGYMPANAIEDIKAVTYYDLKIEKTAGLYRATVTLDI